MTATGTRAIEVVRRAGASEQSTIFVSAGRRGLQLELAPADLARLARANRAQIARDL